VNIRLGIPSNDEAVN